MRWQSKKSYPCWQPNLDSSVFQAVAYSILTEIGLFLNELFIEYNMLTGLSSWNKIKNFSFHDRSAFLGVECRRIKLDGRKSGSIKELN
jgi:hypothetical protein